jgi:serine/threonine protein kinase/tetratricopeptide (TPR) repeat protein
MPLARGDRLGKYEIVATLGSGGMGDVYRALDPRLEREVAIKVIRSAAASPEAHARLWREARAAASISHPGVCQIYDVGESGDQVFIVMELLTGESLSGRLRDGPLKLDEAVAIAFGILGALNALHARHVVHRDLKPSNVYLTGDGIKLLDFGLARSRHPATAEEQAVTQTGMVVGTPRYMAPEQWSEGSLDPRSDLFAAGAILFEMLAGQPAFPGTDLMHVYHAVMSSQPPALSGSQAIAAVDAVIHRALEKRPADRYQTADAMAQALRAAQVVTTDTSTVTARPTTRLIAVPFRMLRPDADVDFLTISLPDAILSSLAGIQSLVVRSTLAGPGYTSGDRLDLKKIAEHAGVDAVLCGTLLRADGQIRVNAQLLEATSGTILWSKTMQLALQDAFDVQDQLARAIVESLSIPLSSGDRRRLRRDLPASARAYEFYLRGNQLAYGSSMMGVAGEMYRSALEEDPEYAPAWAKLGRIYRLQAKYGLDDVEGHLQKAAHAFQRALHINPELSLAHNLYTNFEVESLGHAREAMARLLGRARAQAADPELFAGLVLACRFCGLLDASLAADRQARRLDPVIRTSVMYTHFMLGDWERAIASDAEDLRWVTHWALPLMGRGEEAIAYYRAAEKRPLPALIRSLVAASRQVLEGQHAEAMESLRQCGGGRLLDPEANYFMARAFARLGRPEVALQALEDLVAGGFFCPRILLHDPWLEPLRDRSHSCDASSGSRGAGEDDLCTEHLDSADPWRGARRGDRCGGSRSLRSV